MKKTTLDARIALTFEERYALHALGLKLHDLSRERPNAASRAYSYVEQIPADVLCPEHVRALIRDCLLELPRAALLERHAGQHLKINELTLDEWEARLRPHASEGGTIMSYGGG